MRFYDDMGFEDSMNVDEFIDACESMTIAEEGILKDVKYLSGLRKSVKNMNINEKLKFVTNCVAAEIENDEDAKKAVPLTKEDIDTILAEQADSGNTLLKKGKLGNVYYTASKSDKNLIIDYAFKGEIKPGRFKRNAETKIGIKHKSISAATLTSFIIDQIKNKYAAKGADTPEPEEPAGESMIFDDEYEYDYDGEYSFLNDIF